MSLIGAWPRTDARAFRPAILRSVGISALVVLLVRASFAVSLTVGEPSPRSANPRSLSGITYAGGVTYYAVADDNGPEGGLYQYAISLSADGRTVLSGLVRDMTDGVVKLAGAFDLEAVAYDPLTGNVWAADETRKTIREYDPKTGVIVSELAVPSIIRDFGVANFGLESLTISDDGLTMWTANEEALTCDGERATTTSSTTVRLVKFVRASVRTNFSLAAMYPYTTEKLFRGACRSCRHGVVDLASLPDGSLLVLERDYSSSGIFPVDFAYSVYRVTPQAMARATNVKDVPSLKASEWRAVEKTLLAEDRNVKLVNFEGLCRGPRLADGGYSLLLVSDSGDGFTTSAALPLVLKLDDAR